VADERDRSASQASVQAHRGRPLAAARTGVPRETPEEKHAEAAEHGFDSWDEYVSFCEDAQPQALLERGIGVAGPDESTVDEAFWLDHNMHGSFEFHGSSDDIEDGFSWSYEARFTRGDLDAIVFLGERGGGGPDDYRPDEPATVRF